MVREPPRALPPVDARELPEAAGLGRRLLTFTGLDAAKAIHARGRVYYPLFAGLALSAIEVFGLQFWRTPFMIRTYGWDEARIGAVMAPMLLVGSLLGIFLGGFFVEWMARRYKDANVRAATILFGLVTICSIVSPLMPTGESSLAVMSLGAMFGLAGAVPQNAAIQRVAPNEMRGQVTAIYLFMFTFFGAMGSFVVGSVAQRVIGVEAELWKALVLTAAILLPLATFCMFLAIRPYREEVERLEAETGMR
jgi:MFS family permease